LGDVFYWQSESLRENSILHRFRIPFDNQFIDFTFQKWAEIIGLLDFSSKNIAYTGQK